jgi:branched-chain amino acid transport system ATP-binding protein
MILNLENISTGYEKRQVLFDITFSINKGDIALLIGSNGSGKSTLLKHIFRLIPFFEKGTGKIFFNEENISRVHTSELIGKGLIFIPQKNNIFENLSVLENLEVSGIVLKDKKLFLNRLNEVLELFPLLLTLQNRLPSELSGGEKQLLAFAMASIHKPKMILADEPFSGLSLRNINLVKNQICKLNQTNNVTFLIVEHKVRESFSIATKIIGLKAGKVNKFIENVENLNISELNSIFL